MRFGNWVRQSWWQKTRFAAVFLTTVACLLGIIVIIFVAALANSANLASISWLTFSVFPLVIVILIATLARVQQRINLKSPHSGTRDVSGIKGIQK